MIARRTSILGLMAAAFALASNAFGADAFVVKPYLQIGDDPKAESGDLRLLWQADDVDAAWSVEYEPEINQPFQPAEAPTSRRVAVAGIAPHRVYRVDLKGLVRGRDVLRIECLKDKAVVFESDGEGPENRRISRTGSSRSATSPRGLPNSGRSLAGCRQVGADFAMITGDIVYGRGSDLRISREVLAGLQRRRGFPIDRRPAPADRPSPSPLPGIMTSAAGTWTEVSRTDSPTTITGTSRSTGRRRGRSPCR